MLENLITENYINMFIKAKNKKDALKKIAEFAKEQGIVSEAKEYYKGLLFRENESTTGFGYGIAIPHGRVNAVKKFSLMVVKFDKPIPWDSLDGSPVTMAFVIAVPNSDVDNTHLKILAILARKMMHEEFRDALLNASTKKEILDVLLEDENK